MSPPTLESVQKLQRALHAKAKATNLRSVPAFPNRMESNGLWAFPRSKTALCKRRCCSCWNQSSRPTCRSEQYAYRAERSALDAVQAVHRLLNAGYTEVVDADLSGDFDSIPHAELMQCLARRVSDKAVLHLVKLWLVAPVEERDARGHVHRTTRNKDEGRGSPQGAPIAPPTILQT